MERTKPLYYDEPYLTEFNARVIDVNTSDREYEIVLDKTCFYPEGGGQPSDIGTINDIPVSHVYKKNGVIYHRASSAPKTEDVRGKIDWNHRFDYMQQHSGQHIISAVLYQSMGYNTVSIHFGEDYTSVEADTENMEQEEMVRLEEEVNSIINRNISVEENWTTGENLDEYSLRRPTSVTGDVRIISLGTFDSVACGGVHCRTTGEVGLVKMIGTEKIRGRIRILFKIGRRAYKDVRIHTDVAAQLWTLLSAPLEELPGRASAVLEEYTQLKQELAALKREKVLAEADRMYNTTPPDEDGIRRLGEVLTEYENRDIMDMAKHLIRGSCIHVCLILKETDSLFWCIGCSEDLEFPFKEARAELLQAIEGKGGGRFPVWQGMGRNPEGIEEFIKVWRRNTGR